MRVTPHANHWRAWQKTFRVYAADFPNQYVSVSMGTGLNINDQGKVAGRERKRTRQEVIDEATSILGPDSCSSSAVLMVFQERARVPAPSIL